MRIREILSELDFFGRRCTKDCSGHRAGWEWERKNQKNVRQNTPSTSFNNGTEVAVDQRKVGKQPIGPQIRGAKGRFQKFQKVKESTLTELFNNPVPWEWDRNDNDWWDASFVINNVEYELTLKKKNILNPQTNELEDFGLWVVEFEDPDAGYGITNKQGSKASVVFSTVIDILSNFKKSHPNDTLSFKAIEPTRQKLYNRIVSTFKKSGHEVDSKPSKYGMNYFVR